MLTTEENQIDSCFFAEAVYNELKRYVDYNKDAKKPKGIWEHKRGKRINIIQGVDHLEFNGDSITMLDYNHRVKGVCFFGEKPISDTIKLFEGINALVLLFPMYY